MGELDGTCPRRHERRLGLDRLGDAAVQRSGFAGEQVVEDRLAQEGVTEAEPASVDDHQLGVDGLAQSGVELGLLEIAGARDQCVLGPVAGDRKQAHGGLGGTTERLEADEQHVAQPGGKIGALGAGELLDEERDAIATPKDVRDERCIRAVGAQRRQHCGNAVAVEPRNGVGLHAAESLHLGQERTERVAPVQLVAAVGGDQQHSSVGEGSGDEGDEVTCRGVGPMDVLENDDEWLRFGGPFENLRERFEQAQSVIVGTDAVRQFWQQATE